MTQLVDQYQVALVNHADPNKPEHWHVCEAQDKQGAVEEARAIMSGGKPLFRNGKRLKTGNAMLFHVLANGMRKPVSLKFNMQRGPSPVGERLNATALEREKRLNIPRADNATAQVIHHPRKLRSSI